jgi:hypothetical protein
MFAELNKINKERQRTEAAAAPPSLETEPNGDQTHTNPSPKTPSSPPSSHRSHHSPSRASGKTVRATESASPPLVVPTPSPQTGEQQSIDRSIVQSIDRTPVMGKPKGFYITEKQHADIDIAVENLAHLARNKVDQKIDRSTVIRLLLEEVDITSPDITEKLYHRLVNRLVSRLNS